MSKKWKIIWSIIGGIALIVVISIGALVYFGGQFVNNMRATAQEIYGGPVPSTVTSIIALDLKKSKMGVFVDNTSQLAVVFIENPPTSEPNPPFSEPDVQKALSSMDATQKEIQNSLKGSGEGIPSTLTLGDQTVHTLRYTDNKKQQNEVGVLNLDQHQLVFIATATQAGDNSQAISNFLQSVPAIKNDSHLKK